MTTHTDHDTSEHPGLDEPRPGQELRVARERAGISREYMAERLRLAVAQFDALEHDDYAELPPPAFVRGYFRVYARELGLDPDEYIAAYNRSGVSGRDPEIRRGGVTDTSSGGRGGMIGLVLIALVAVGGIGAWWYQQRMVDDGGGSGATDSVEEEPDGANEPDTGDSRDPAGDDTDTDDSGAATDDGGDETASGEVDRDAGSNADAEANADAGADTDADADADADADTDTDTASVDVDAAVATVAAADGGDDEAEQPTVAAPDRESLQSGGGDGGADDGTELAEAGNPDTGNATEDDAGDDVAAAEDDAEDDVAESAADDEPGATSPAATDSPTRVATEAASTGPDEIRLEFSARSWLEVYDDRERELAYTLYFGSEPVTLQGWAPFEVFLGNSPAVDVQFNGEAIDKSAFTRSNNTARFVVDASGVRAP